MSPSIHAQLRASAAMDFLSTDRARLDAYHASRRECCEGEGFVQGYAGAAEPCPCASDERVA